MLERDKYAAKAKITGWTLNAAIGLQVLFGSLTTGLSAVATSGRSVRWRSVFFFTYVWSINVFVEIPGCGTDDHSRFVIFLPSLYLKCGWTLYQFNLCIFLGGLSTIVASYLARARGSNEPELSITRVKDLEHFIRECRAFQMDFGHQTGSHHDGTVLALRNKFEELLGNANGYTFFSSFWRRYSSCPCSTGNGNYLHLCDCPQKFKMPEIRIV